ncbi:MAG TPA: MFS transporter [Anaerolineae bacterium]|nr:MFS transporter [Anaerolineae bacterium]
MPEPINDDPMTALRAMRRALSLSSFPIGILTLGIPFYGAGPLHLDSVQIGVLVSIYALMMLIMRPFVGPAMDRYGRRRFFLAGLTLQIFSNAFFAIGSSYDWLFWGRLTQGVAAGLLWLSAYAITADLAAKSHAGNMFGAVEEMLARGGLYGAILGAPLLLATNFAQWAWTTMFVIYAGLNVIGLWVAIKRVPETWQKQQRTTPAYASVIERPRVQQFLNAVPQQLWLLASIVVCTSTAKSGLEPVLIQFVQKTVTSNAALVALAYVPSAVVFAFLQSRLGKVSDRVGRRKPVAAGLFISGLSSAIVPSMTLLMTWIGQFVLLPLSGFWTAEAVGFSAATPAEQALVADLSDAKTRGRSFSVYTTALSIGQVIGPTLGGFLYRDVALSAPFYFNTIVLWSGAAIMMAFIHEPRRHVAAANVEPMPHEPPAQWPSGSGK